eukprot:10636097-Heterocapsa_arctica.AAC.1
MAAAGLESLMTLASTSSRVVCARLALAQSKSKVIRSSSSPLQVVWTVTRSSSSRSLLDASRISCALYSADL